MSTCVYVNCRRKRQHCPGIRFFSFPIKDKERLRKWILNSGNIMLLGMDVEKLRNRFLCDAHFEDSSFMNETKHRLTHSAVPLKHRTVDVIPSASEFAATAETDVKPSPQASRHSSLVIGPMNTIKTEPEVDPLAINGSDDDNVEEKNTITEEGNLYNFHAIWIKKECVDPSYDVASDIHFEETGVPHNLSAIKSEAEDAVTEEVKLEGMAHDNETLACSIPKIKKRKTCYVPGCLSSNRKDPNLAFFHFPSSVKRVQQWTERLGMPYNEETAKKLFHRIICSHHFSDTDFKTKEKKRLNRFAVPSLQGSRPIAHSTTEPTQLSSEKNLTFQQPFKTYQRKSLALRPLSFTVEHTPVVPAVDNTISVTEPSCPVGSASESACGREEENVSIPDSAA